MRVGSVEIIPLLDSIGQLGELEELYPDAPAEEWGLYAELYPEVCVEGEWRLPCISYLLSAGERNVLVDTGTGPPGIFWDNSPELEARLPGALADHGVSPGDVDTVFITHIHGDHVGWNTDEAGAPTFPSARYLLHPVALARARERSAEDHIKRAFGPLFERELVDAVEPGTEIAPGVAVVAMPGHAPGHSGLRLSSDGEAALMIGDAIPHPVLADRPDWTFVWDQDQLECTATRATLLAELVDTGVFVACGHYPGSGIGELRTRDGRVVFEPLDRTDRIGTPYSG